MSGFQAAFPDLTAGAFGSIEILYYNAMEAVLQALDAVDGELSDGQRRFQAALAEVELDSPIGRITLDGNRQAVGPNFLERLERDEHGNLVVRTFRTIENVEQTFNGYFTPESPPPGPDEPECKQSNPPPWAVAEG